MIDLENMSAMQDSYLLQKQVEMIIESANKKLLQEINMLKGSMQRLNEEIVQLKKERKSAPSIPSSNLIELSAESKESGKESGIKPRYGEYGPKDAAIDKFFYFGKK